MHASHAILLRKRLLTESSLVVVWCTEEFGKVSTAARGARRRKSAFSGQLDLFHHCRIAFVPSLRGSLHTLTEADAVETFPGIALRYLRLQAASYFSALVDRACEEDVEVPGVHDLLLRALRYLDDSDPTIRAVRHFENELALLLGYGSVAGPAERGCHALSDHGALPHKPRHSLMQTLRGK